MGCGVIGGLLRDWRVVGERIGREVLARLDQPSNAVGSVPVKDYTVLEFDERQLRRWNIPSSRLPAGAVVRFRRPNLWRDHRATVVGAIAVTTLQSLLIGGLVWEHRRRRNAELESRRHLAGMAHLDRRAAMGELATSLAHELNQPLNAILQNVGVAQMLLRKHPSPPELSELSDIVGDIRKDDLRASEVIRRMRGLLEKHELEAQPVDLTELANESVAVVRAEAKAREIQIETETVGALPHVLGDRVHLQQVVLKLLMNAMDAVAGLPPERRRVRVTTSSAEGMARLRVSDTGSGIPADHLSTIFEPFYTTKPGGRGMGMGLPIARSIVDAHNGELGAFNNPAAGATVWFAIPVGRRPAV
jgi:signal transduction histidine kinase